MGMTEPSKKRRLMKPLILCSLLPLVVTACANLLPPDTGATLAAQNNAIIAEATAIRETNQAQEARIVATASAVETAAFRINAINRELLATVRAVVPPTQALIASANNAASTPVAGQFRLLQTGTGTGVRTEDGCVTSPQISFPADTTQIYATVRAFNIAAGTPVSVEWMYAGENVWSESFSMERSAAEICLWFFIEPSVVPFTPGEWSVNIVAGGLPADAPMRFTIEDAAVTP